MSDDPKLSEGLDPDQLGSYARTSFDPNQVTDNNHPQTPDIFLEDGYTTIGKVTYVTELHVREYAKLYHSQRLQEAGKELPKFERIDAIKFTPTFTSFGGQHTTQAEYTVKGNVLYISIKTQGTPNRRRYHRLPSYPYGHPLYYMNPRRPKAPRITYKTPTRHKSKPRSKPKWFITLPYGKLIKDTISPISISLPFDTNLKA